jgi:hypothetical protein
MIQPAFKRYPTLRERFNLVVLGFLKKSMEPTKKLVSDLVAFVPSNRIYSAADPISLIVCRPAT